MNMMYYALSTDINAKFKAFSGEAWAEAGKVTLLGLGMIFAVLALLWLVLSVFKLLFVKSGGKKPIEKKTEKAPVAEPAPVSTPTASEDEALVAVITAAIAAYRASEEGMDSAQADGYRDVSFKRAGRGRSWNSNK